MNPEILAQMDPKTRAMLEALMRQQQQGQQAEVGAAEAMGPDGMQRLTALGTLPDRMAMGRESFGQESAGLQNDIASGQELQARRFGNSGSAAGNALGGIGDVVNSLRGGFQEQGARSGLAEALKRHQASQGGMLDQQDKTRGEYAAARLAALKSLMGGQREPGALSVDIGTPTVLRRG